jgi:hypothetical protein
MPARRISQILDAAPHLRDLAQASLRIEQLQRIYRESVPVELGKASRIGWARANVISVTARNGAVAAKLRHLAPRVLAHLRQRGFEFNSMRIEVQVAPTLQDAPARPPKRLTAQALSAIERALGEVPDSPLKGALARLARRR